MADLTEAERRIRAGAKGGEILLSGLGLTTLSPLLPTLKSAQGVKAIDLSDNALTELPADLGDVLPLVVRLNMAANPIRSVRTVLVALRGLPALRDLWIDLPLETEEDQLIVALPNLERFNGTSLVDDNDDAPDADPSDGALPPQPTSHATHERPVSGRRGSSPSAAYWTAGATQAIETLFAEVSEASAGGTQPDEFFDYLSRVTKHVTCLTAADDDPLCQEGEVLKARRLLFQYCFEEMAKAVARADPALGRGVEAVLQYATTLMDDGDTHWRRIFRDRDARLTLMKKDMKDAIKQIESLMTQVGESASGAKADSGSVANFRSVRNNEERGREPVTRNQEEEDEEVSDETALQAQGDPSARHHGRAAAPPSAALVDYERHTALPGRVAHGARGLNRSGYGGTPEGRRVDSTGGSGSRNATGSRSRVDASTTEAVPRGKVLTLKQLKDTIEDIYASKTKYDAKCKENGLPRETMEQHMYTYLNQRYGLKEIIQDWATAIARGIRRYAADDNDVAVFGKILRNDIDEEFRYVQRQVRDTVRELVRAQIKARRPLKGDREINEQLERKMSGALSEEEWGDVVRYMYNKNDAATLVALIRKTIYQQTLPSRVRRQGKTAAASSSSESFIPYKDLVHLLLDFQLEGHERFLAEYVSIFRRYDRDGNGIVNSEEFKAIVRCIDNEKSEEEVEAMANLIDPFGSQLITFSETVTFLSDELVAMALG